MRRLPAGCLSGWPAWAESHPQRAEPARVLEGRGPMRMHDDPGGGAPNGAAAELSVLSWNVLSPTWLAKCAGDPEYAEVPAEMMQWSARRAHILAWLTSLAPDVIALQEVDIGTFHEDFAEPLAAAGYAGLMQNHKKRSASQPCGNATFWRRDLLEKVWEDHRSRTLLLGFKLRHSASPREIVFINAHLEATQSKTGTRAQQVHSSLERAAKTSSEAAVVLAGDFNCGGDCQLAAVLRCEEWHGFRMASAYEHPAAETTSPAVDATFSVLGHSYLIDHIWYRSSHLRLRALLQPLLQEERAWLKEGGLPNGTVPSDHIPIGAVLSLH